MLDRGRAERKGQREREIVWQGWGVKGTVEG